MAAKLTNPDGSRALAITIKPAPKRIFVSCFEDSGYSSPTSEFDQLQQLSNDNFAKFVAEEQERHYTEADLCEDLRIQAFQSDKKSLIDQCQANGIDTQSLLEPFIKEEKDFRIDREINRRIVLEGSMLQRRQRFDPNYRREEQDNAHFSTEDYTDDENLAISPAPGPHFEHIATQVAAIRTLQAQHVEKPEQQGLEKPRRSIDSRKNARGYITRRESTAPAQRKWQKEPTEAESQKRRKKAYDRAILTKMAGSSFPNPQGKSPTPEEIDTFKNTAPSDRKTDVIEHSQSNCWRLASLEDIEPGTRSEENWLKECERRLCASAWTMAGLRPWEPNSKDNVGWMSREEWIDLDNRIAC